MPKLKNFKFPNNSRKSESRFYWKIFSFNYLETFNYFIESILKHEKNLSTEFKLNSLNSNENYKKKISLKIEKKLFKFLFMDKKLKTNLNSSVINQTKSTAIIKKRMVINCSKYFEFCYEEKFFSKNFTEMNKIIFYYLINFYDISNRKTYQYFNIYIVLYFIMNDHIDESFKRFVVSRFLVNMDLLKFSHFLILLDEISKCEKENLINLFHPFNPLKINSQILGNFFRTKNNQNISGNSINESEIFSPRDLIQIVNLSKKFPINQKIILIENLIRNLNENNLKSLTTIELLHFIKSLKIIEIEFKSFNNNQQKFERIKSLVYNLKIKAEIKLKFHFKKSSQEFFYSNIPKFLILIKEIGICGKYIDDKEIFEEFFLLIRKSAMKNDTLNSVINSLFEIFIELHPNFVFQLFVQDWREKIFRDENVGRIIKNVLKCVLYYSLQINDSSSEINSENFGIFKDFVKNLYYDPQELSQNKINCTINDLIEISLYMILIYEMKFVTFEESQLENKKFEEDEKVLVEFLKYQMKTILKFLHGNLELKMNLENFVEKISSMIEGKKSDENMRLPCSEFKFNFDLLSLSENKEDAFNFLFLICSYLILSKSENREFIKLFEDDEINFKKIKILFQELKDYRNKENNNYLNTFNSKQHSFSISDGKINREIREIVSFYWKFSLMNMESNLFLYTISEILEYPNGYYEIKIEKYKQNSESRDENFLYISFSTDDNERIRKELKEKFIEKFMHLIVKRKNSKTISIDFEKWIKSNKEEKFNLIKDILS